VQTGAEGVGDGATYELDEAGAEGVGDGVITRLEDAGIWGDGVLDGCSGIGELDEAGAEGVDDGVTAEPEDVGVWSVGVLDSCRDETGFETPHGAGQATWLYLSVAGTSKPPSPSVTLNLGSYKISVSSVPKKSHCPFAQHESTFVVVSIVHTSGVKRVDSSEVTMKPP